MRLTILGKSPSWPDRDGACSGYLLELGGRPLLIDCGNGVFAKLRSRQDYAQIDDVIISHLHADHVFHLPTLVAARALQCRGADPLRIVGPRGTGDVLDKLGRTGFGDGFWEEVIRLGPPALEEWDGGQSGQLGAFRVTAFTVDHSTQLSCLGYSLEREGIALGYSGDSTLCPGIRELAGSVDYLLCECTSMSGPVPIHLWRDEVEQLISDYPDTRFILTHLTERAPVKGAILGSDGLVLRLRPSAGG